MEEKLITTYANNPWVEPDSIPDHSTQELLTVALAVHRYDLIPYHWKDPLLAYRTVLNNRQTFLFILLQPDRDSEWSFGLVCQIHGIGFDQAVLHGPLIE